MATTIEKFVFGTTKVLVNEGYEADEGSEGVDAVYETKINTEQDFEMPADARVVYVKIDSHGRPAFYAMVDHDQPMVTRRFAAYPSRVELPSDFAYIGSACNGRVTYHVGGLVTKS